MVVRFVRELFKSSFGLPPSALHVIVNVNLPISKVPIYNHLIKMICCKIIIESK